ncbi:hypothetical protein DRQ36_03010 [bacterium]|nr:MAG: hypothetical protein DRQ36_03010 [bacterium]
MQFFLAIAVAQQAAIVNPEEMDISLSQAVCDSTLSVRAELAYARGLYQSAKDLAERIESPTQKDLLFLGQCCHVLAQSYAARGYFARVTDAEYLPLAQLGLAELYCGDIADPDSCARYIELVEQMDYLDRFVELSIPGGNVPPVRDTIEETSGRWALQFGAFSMMSLAEKMAVKVKGEGLKTWIVPVEQGGDTLYLVYGGSFATKAEAAARADALAKEFACKVTPMPE